MFEKLFRKFAYGLYIKLTISKYGHVTECYCPSCGELMRKRLHAPRAKCRFCQAHMTYRKVYYRKVS